MKLFFSKILVYLVQKISSVYAKAFLCKLKREFYSIGNNSVIEYPFYLLGASHITIGNDFTARKRLKLRAFTTFNNQQFTPIIRIGDYVSIETDCHISCINEVIIGDHVLIASGVYISDHAHGKPDFSDILKPPIERELFSKGNIVIGNNVWIGERAVILPGVHVGDNSIIGANSVVTRSQPANCIIAGVPAEVMKQLDINS